MSKKTKNVDKLPSGSYRVRKMVNGKSYTITFDHNPTMHEIDEKMRETIGKAPMLDIEGSVYQNIEGYIKSKENVLSPATIRGYRGIQRQIDENILKMPIRKVTLPILQNEVNRYAEKHSPKSVSNFSSLLVSVCHYVGLDIQSPTLPQKEVHRAYIPQKEDIERLCEYFRGTEYEIPILLSTYGLRRSEICALSLSDLSGNVLSINKALVEDQNRTWIIKTTKTIKSTRKIVISDYLANLIKEKGYIYKRSPGQIYEQLQNAQIKLGIPQFPLHKMRHFFASYLHDLGYSDKQIQDAGGWKTSRIMDSVYKHAMEMDEALIGIATDISQIVDKKS